MVCFLLRHFSYMVVNASKSRELMFLASILLFLLILSCLISIVTLDSFIFDTRSLKVPPADYSSIAVTSLSCSSSIQCRLECTKPLYSPFAFFASEDELCSCGFCIRESIDDNGNTIIIMEGDGKILTMYFFIAF